MHIKNFEHTELRIDTFTSHPGESWCLLGDNHSGIDRFIDLLSGKLDTFSADILELPHNPGILTFRSQQELFENELRNDDSDFLDRMDPGTLVREFLPNHQAHATLLETFGMAHCLDLGYRQLSSGQARKLLLLRELTRGTSALVLQNPYDGLDEQSCLEMNQALAPLPRAGVLLLISVNSLCDIPPWTSHLALIENGRMTGSGPRERILPFKTKASQCSTTQCNADTAPVCAPSSAATASAGELVFLRNGFAGYGGRKLFNNLNLIIHTDDHTLITGSNGCGKSTLLDIITGDNPKCYANDLRIFGQKRGTGESIWDVKKHMGIVSPALHREHHIPGTAIQVVLSGLYDSIGLYRKASPTEIRSARKWLAWINLSERAEYPFRRLTFAEQRLLLITRALIKGPRLLILDEPTQGLDDCNRHKLLALLDDIAERHLSTILFVSHRRDEHLPLFRQHIRLDAHAS